MTPTPFWELTSPHSTNKLAEWVHEEMKLEIVSCPIDEAHNGPGKRLTNLTVKLPSKHVDNLVWTWLSECLIQDHVLETFKEEKLTGFAVEPVRARFDLDNGTKPPRLWELIVKGQAGVAPPESGIRRVFECPGCGYTKYSDCSAPGKLIDESQWDGSDFFTIWPLNKFIFITDRVARVLKRERWRGYRLVAPRDLTFSGSGFTSGRMQDYAG
jgi:hypothetical protein